MGETTLTAFDHRPSVDRANTEVCPYSVNAAATEMGRRGWHRSQVEKPIPHIITVAAVTTRATTPGRPDKSRFPFDTA
jgi:hypothetical protein